MNAEKRANTHNHACTGKKKKKKGRVPSIRLQTGALEGGNLSCDGSKWGLWRRCHIAFGWNTGATRGREGRRARTLCTDIMNLGDGLGAWADTVILSQLVVFYSCCCKGKRKETQREVGRGEEVNWVQGRQEWGRGTGNDQEDRKNRRRMRDGEGPGMHKQPRG